VCAVSTHSARILQQPALQHNQQQHADHTDHATTSNPVSGAPNCRTAHVVACQNVCTRLCTLDGVRAPRRS
jgi:hypothetical protein